jgi:hypothetical protein
MRLLYGTDFVLSCGVMLKTKSSPTIQRIVHAWSVTFARPHKRTAQNECNKVCEPKKGRGFQHHDDTVPILKLPKVLIEYD